MNAGNYWHWEKTPNNIDVNNLTSNSTDESLQQGKSNH